MSEGKSYFVILNDQQVGPVTVDALLEMAKQNPILPGTLVWTEGMENWAPVSQTPLAALLMSRPMAPPPPPTAWKPPDLGRSLALTGAHAGAEKGTAPIPGIGFVDAIKLGFLKYAVFKGRASRSEYWWFTLFYFLSGVVAGIIPILLIFWLIGLLVPALAVAVRRLHDTGRSGWWYLISFVPIVGFLVLIYFLVQPSQAEQNQYG